MDLASYIDHTMLQANATSDDIERVCKEAMKHKFAAVCINPCYVRLAAGLLKGSGIGIATVVGFPLGASTTTVKILETENALKKGATEIDMVMAIGLMKGKELKRVEKDIREVVETADDCLVKVILETCYLTQDEIIDASIIAACAGAAYIKTSTGFGSRGATIEDLEVIRSAIGERCKIKASGGIKTRQQAIAMIEAGASRIGTSSGVAIITK